MNVNTNSLVSITEANRNFSKVARLVDENGSAVILKNNILLTSGRLKNAPTFLTTVNHTTVSVNE